MTKNNISNLFLKIQNIDDNNINNLQSQLKKLMKLEKEKLGYNKNDLIFISAGDISKFYWCPMQTYFTLKNNEIKKFAGYLRDKIEYSIKFKKYNKTPKTFLEILQIGDNLKLYDIFNLLNKKEYLNIENENKILEAKTKLKSSKLPTQKGHYYEIIYGKNYPKIHWFVKHKNFIFTCEPDGIEKKFIYEFKSCKNKYLAKQSILKAKLQSDIYCLCFKKQKKIIDIFIISENKIKTYKETFNENNLNLIIDEIKKIIDGKLPKPPKEKFKCKTCEYKNKCTIKHL